jgi:hypothetical protein
MVTVSGFRTLMLAVASAAVVVGCGVGGPPPGGDPDNKYLNELTHDPIFAAVPRHAQALAPIAETPARYASPGFDAGGWHGPGATLTFISTQAPGSVFSYYRDRASQTGWTLTGNRNVLGYPDVWSKSAADGTPEHLSLTDMNIATAASGSPSRYVLNATSIPG